MADEQAAPEGTEEQKPSGGMMRMMMMGLGMFIIVLAAQTVAPLITSKLGLAPAPVMQAGDDAAGDSDEPQDDGPPLYWPLKPALIVNFTSQGDAGFLQVEMEVMTRNQATVDAVKEHTPALRDALLMLLAAQDEATIFSSEGKEALRAQALDELNRVLEPYVAPPGLEAVYFTSFVAQ